MVVFSGANPVDMEVAKKMYVLVRRKECEMFAKHLLEKSASYQTTSPNPDFLEEMKYFDMNEKLVEDEGVEGNLIHMAYSDADRVTDGFNGSSTPLDSSSGLFHLSKSVAKVPTTVEEVSSNSQSSIKHLRVVNSNYFIEESDLTFYGSAFPHLFPYGIGSPNCERPVRVSVEEGLKHLLSLADRKFGKDDVFVLAGFDRVARCKAVARMYVKLKSDPSSAADAVEATRNQMVALLNHNKEVKKALRSGRNCPQIPIELKTASRVLRGVESVASSTYGTEEERLKMRSIIHGYTQVS